MVQWCHVPTNLWNLETMFVSLQVQARWGTSSKIDVVNLRCTQTSLIVLFSHSYNFLSLASAVQLRIMCGFKFLILTIEILYTSLQQQYALLLACVAKDHHRHCVIRSLEMMTFQNDPITDEFECPLLTMTDNVFMVPPNSVEAAVSLIHQCTQSCPVGCASTRLSLEARTSLNKCYA